MAARATRAAALAGFDRDSTLDIKQAQRLAQKFVGNAACVAPCDVRPTDIYWLEDVDEYLFTVRRQDRFYVGGDEIVAVNKATGVVRSAGNSGE